MKTSKIYEFGIGNLGGGLGIYAKNVSGSDWPTVVVLSGVTALVDGQRLSLDMCRRFNNENCISQVKQFLRSINPNISFSDEPEQPSKAYADDGLYTPEQVSSVAKLNKGNFTAEQRDIFQWGCKKGYIISQSYTQYHVTQKFIEWRNASDKAA